MQCVKRGADRQCAGVGAWLGNVGNLSSRSQVGEGADRQCVGAMCWVGSFTKCQVVQIDSL